MLLQKRALPFAVKAIGAEGRISGYASVFDEVDAQQERVARGAFARSLYAMKQRRRLPPMLWMHDARQPVGVWDAVREDPHGLAVEGQLALGAGTARDAYELLKMGAVTGLSIGYRTVASEVNAKTRIRTLLEVDLLEVSLVTFPANGLARVDAVKVVRTQDAVRRIRETIRKLRK
jgi:HK97 family phage prohead protease